MTSINSLYSGQYYQLPGQDTSSTAASDSAAPSLADMLSQSATQTPDAVNNASYLLNLSDEAQSYLSGLSTNSAAPQQSQAIDPKATFALDSKQEAQLQSIIAKYKDAPFDQATYEQIQSDLSDAGLAPDQLSAKEQVKSFNPTMVLLSLLNGTDPSALPSTSETQDQLQTKSNNYMSAVYKQWQGMSTTAVAAADDTSA